MTCASPHMIRKVAEEIALGEEFHGRISGHLPRIGEMSVEPHWPDKESLVVLHDRKRIALHGGVHGLRDEGLLESALARPYKSSSL